MDKKTVIRIRKRLKMTPAEFARLVGVHRSAVLRWETGKRNVSGMAQRVIRQIVAEAKAAQ